MADSRVEMPTGGGHAGCFVTTHWSVVLAAREEGSPQAEAALGRLCRTYWFPLYAYVRRRGFGPEEAEDLTQEFFARLLARRELPKAGPEKGRFRFFLLLRLKHFLVNEWERLRAAKRGGGTLPISLERLKGEERLALEPPDLNAPDRMYERRWALSLLDHVFGRLKAECESEQQGERFEELKDYLEGGSGNRPYAEAALALGISEGAVKVAVHRLRQRYQALIREEIANTVAGPADVEDELRHLRSVLSA